VFVFPGTRDHLPGAMSKRSSPFQVLPEALVPLIFEQLDVVSVRRLFEVLCLDRVMRPSCNFWLRDVYVLPSLRFAAAPVRQAYLDETLRWFATKAGQAGAAASRGGAQRRAIHLYDVPPATAVELASGSLLSPQVHTLKLFVIGRSARSAFEQFARLIISLTTAARLSNLVHLEVYWDDEDENDEAGDTNSTSTLSYELVAALQRHCPALNRLEGLSSWPGFGSLHDLVGPRAKSFNWARLQHLTFWDMLPAEWTRPADFAGGGMALAPTGPMQQSPLLDEIFDDAVYPAGDVPWTRAWLLRSFRPLTRTIFPALTKLEVHFRDAQDAMRFFVCWHTLAFPLATSEVPDVCARQITALIVHIEVVDPTKQFELYSLWNKLMRSISERRCGPLLPALTELTIDSWLPSAHLIKFLVGGGGGSGGSKTVRPPLRLSLCPGDEDAATAQFLEHLWNEDDVRIETLSLSRRTLSGQGTMFRQYLETEQRVDASCRLKLLGSRSGFGLGGFYSEYVTDDAFAVHGADYGVARTTVVRALRSALESGKLRHTRALGVPDQLLESMGCSFRGDGVAVQQAQRDLLALFGRDSCPVLESLVVFFKHPDSSVELQSSQGGGRSVEAATLLSVARFAHAWSCALERDLQATQLFEQQQQRGEGKVGGKGEEEEEEGPPASLLCPLRELRVSLPLDLPAYMPHWQVLLQAAFGPSAAVRPYLLSADQTLGTGKDQSLLRITFESKCRSTSLFLCRG